MSVTSVRVELFKPVIAAVLDDDAGKFVVKTTLKVLNRAKVLCPVDTGLLRAAHQMSIYRRTDLIYGTVYNKVKYAEWVHNGNGFTGAGRVYPVHAHALAFTWKGKHWVLASVKAHKARPWLYRALREVAPAEGFRMTRGAKYGTPASR